ncbi:surface antigen-like protein [Alteromonadaceae bacterium 2753L.S.0a.02]|nr:surface antigen-like protein [Alteromonadaceae bacterium 2753L.S.0a.02]
MGVKFGPCLVTCLVLFAVLDVATARAKPPVTVKVEIDRAEQPGKDARTTWIPYGFSTQSTGFNLGLGYLQSPFLQQQATVGATVFGGESRAALAGVWNLSAGHQQRWYFSALAMTADFAELKAYALPDTVGLSPDLPRPGSHHSREQDFIAAEGENHRLDVYVDYVLPFGSAAQRGLMVLQTRGGLLQSESPRSGNWNPLKSGVTIASLHYLQREQRYHTPPQEIEGKAKAWQWGLLYDNSDFSINPSQGSSQYVSYTFDRSGNKTEHWNLWQLESSHYWKLPTPSWTRQQVVALNTWMAYSPSYREFERNGLRYIENAPLFSEGASLGGFYQMRGYDSSRFHDKAAFYLGTELRQTLQWNPLGEISWLKFLKVDWMQLVVFAELGRVASQFDKTLLQAVKKDVGAGLRVMAAATVFRFDVAASDEGVQMWLMVSQPY